MKKTIPIIIIILLLIIFILKSKPKTELNNNEELRAIFVSYIEISNYLQDREENESKENIKTIIKNIKEMNLNTIIFQVRPSNDAVYKSNIFPVSKYLSSNNEYNYDVLKYFVKESHKQNIKIYAWINPYRINTLSNTSEIKEDNPAFKYLNTDTIYINNGIYYNPSKEVVTNLIVEGVKEVLNYKVDGIIFDDYFYPSDDIDIVDYEKTNKEKSLEEYHLSVINNMVEKVHDECKKKNIPFGISPEGNIENNYHKNYADVEKWLSSDKYVDFIMPQIYYGFNNSSKPFINTVEEWNDLIKNKNIKLYIALAIYKVGKEDEYGGNGKNEWIDNNNIIMKEIIYSRNLNNYKGFSLYRYDNIFNESLYQKTSTKEIKNIKSLLK